MTALVTKHLPLLADAPDGIRRIRQLIVDLAVSGKLIPKGGTDDWQQVQLSDIVTSFQNGVSSRGAADGQAVAVLRLADIKSGEISLDDLRTLMLDAGTIEKYLLVDGDMLVIRVNGSADLVGRFIVHRESGGALHCDHFIRLRLDRERIEPRFLKLIGDCSSTRASIQGLFVSTAGQKTVNQGHIGSLAVPLPPLAKQHLIVTKVDELMALCDRLEADQADAEAAHAQLVLALLDSLTHATDAADFRASWQRLSEHFHTLFTTEASIDALKQTVLQLAVMGKLVPQVDEEESAEKVLLRIESLGTTSRRKNSPTQDAGSPKPYALPIGWCWTTFPQIGELARGKSKHRPRNDPALYSGGTIPLVQTGDVARANGVIYTSTGRYNTAGLAQSRLWPRGTMCITIAANIADSSILGFDACFPDSVVGFVPCLPELDVRYFEYFLRTAKADIQKFAPSTAQKNINLEILGNIYVPLPPPAEKNNPNTPNTELMALCDQLKTQLATARQQHAQLASVLVEQAVAA